MRLVAQIIRVDGPFLDQILVLYRRIVDAEVVVRQVVLLLADDLPGVALGRAIEAVIVVHRAQTGRRHRVVETHFRRLAYAAHARQVLPGHGAFVGVVVGLVADRDEAFLPLRQQEAVVEVGVDVVLVGKIILRIAAQGHVGEFLPAPGDAAAGVDIGDVADAGFGPDLAGVGHIPDRLQPALRNREQVTAAHAGDALAVMDHFGIDRVLFGVVADPVRRREIAVAGIDIHAIGLRVLGEQGLLAVGELVRILRRVLRRDREQRLLRHIRAGLEAVGPLHAGPGALVLAGVFGHSPRSAGLLGADAGQAGTAQFGGLVRGYLGLRGGDRERGTSRSCA